MNLQNIEQVYTYLEQNIIDVRRNWKLTAVLKKLIDEAENESEKNRLRWEILVFDFEMEDGKVIPIVYSSEEDPLSVNSYPSYDGLKDEGLNYLSDRAEAVQNPYLVARYNQLLWNANRPFKHHKHAKKAIDAYLEIIVKIENLKRAVGDSDDRLFNIANALHLAAQIKYKTDELKNIAQTWLYHRRSLGAIEKINLVRLMLELACFKKNDFQNSLKLIESIGKHQRKQKPELFFEKEIYKTGLEVARKLGTDLKEWNKRIGDSLLRMAKHRMDDETRLVPLSLLKDALPYYKLAADEKKVKQVELLYFSLKKELRLTKYELPLNDETDKQFQEYLSCKTARLMDCSAEELFSYLLTGDDIFPRRAWLMEMNQNLDNAFMYLSINMRFDINNNVSTIKDTKESRQKLRIFENYDIYMRITVLPFLHRIFLEGVKKRKLTYDSLIRFIVKETWLGQQIEDTDNAGDKTTFRWISMIAPSLFEYFLQVESALYGRIPYPNFILAIDSLTLKFEGMLRDFAKLIQVSTTVTGKGNVLREKYIEEILTEPEVQKFFDEDDLLFFNYLFVAKEGLNLRNNIAHSFFRFNNYHFDIMHLLICAVLRIGKYRLSKAQVKIT